MKPKYLKNYNLPNIYDKYTNEYVILIGVDVKVIRDVRRYFFKLYDGKGIYKREIFIK